MDRYGQRFPTDVVHEALGTAKRGDGAGSRDPPEWRSVHCSREALAFEGRADPGSHRAAALAARIHSKATGPVRGAALPGVAVTERIARQIDASTPASVVPARPAAASRSALTTETAWAATATWRSTCKLSCGAGGTADANHERRRGRAHDVAMRAPFRGANGTDGPQSSRTTRSTVAAVATVAAG